MHATAKELLTMLVRRHVDCDWPAGNVLEVGSRQVTPADWTPRGLFPPAWLYHGLDIAPGRNVDLICAETGIWPQSWFTVYDVVVSANALEHCRRPWEVVQNVFRVLKPGGLFLAVAPFMWPLHNFPSDYFRFTGSGLASLIEAAHGEVLESGELESERFKWDAFAVGRA